MAPSSPLMNITFVNDLFPMDKSAIKRWFSINSDTLYKMNEVDGYTIAMYFHTTMVNNNKKQPFWLFQLVICVVNIYLLPVFHAVR